MIKNADITLYHKAYDPSSRLDVWTHTQYEGVSWHGRQAVTVGGNGLNTADAYTVRIFTGAAIAASSGDIVIRGLVDLDDPQKARKTAAASFLVTSVADNRRGPDHMQHWRIEGK